MVIIFINSFIPKSTQAQPKYYLTTTNFKIKTCFLLAVHYCDRTWGYAKKVLQSKRIQIRHKGAA